VVLTYAHSAPMLSQSDCSFRRDSVLRASLATAGQDPHRADCASMLVDSLPAVSMNCHSVTRSAVAAPPAVLREYGQIQRPLGVWPGSSALC
jgi:hypothetical protein